MHRTTIAMLVMAGSLLAGCAQATSDIEVAPSSSATEDPDAGAPSSPSPRADATAAPSMTPTDVPTFEPLDCASDLVGSSSGGLLAGDDAGGFPTSPEQAVADHPLPEGATLVEGGDEQDRRVFVVLDEDGIPIGEVNVVRYSDGWVVGETTMCAEPVPGQPPPPMAALSTSEVPPVIRAVLPDGCALVSEPGGPIRQHLRDQFDMDSVEGRPWIAMEVDSSPVMAVALGTAGDPPEAVAAWSVAPDAVKAVNDVARGVATQAAGAAPDTSANLDGAVEDLLAECAIAAALRHVPWDGTYDGGAMVIDPEPAEPGDLLVLSHPGEEMRGLGYSLQVATPIQQAWYVTHRMASDANGDPPATAPAFTEDFDLPEVGIAGPGPDHVILPDDLPPDTYRICPDGGDTTDCTQLEVVSGS